MGDEGVRLGSELMDLTMALRRSVRRRLRAAAPSPELRPTQVELMLVVARRPGLSVAAAARELHLADNSVSTLVNQLVRAGMLVRRTDPADRRAARLEVTPAARRRIEDWRDRRARLVGARLEDLPAGDRAAIEAALPALRRLLTLLREPPPAGADAGTGARIGTGAGGGAGADPGGNPATRTAGAGADASATETTRYTGVSDADADSEARSASEADAGSEARPDADADATAGATSRWASHGEGGGDDER